MTEERHKPDVLRAYEGAGIVVLWEPALCIHVGRCLAALPTVFNVSARPWVDVTAADSDAIAEAIERCPTGALRYDRTDGAEQERPADPTVVEPRTNGPLFVRGAVEIASPGGATTRTATRLALCRCGHSGNKPYCDLSHRARGFVSD